MQSIQKETLVRKLEGLSTARLAEVEDSIDFLMRLDEDRAITQATMPAPEPAYRTIWRIPRMRSMIRSTLAGEEPWHHAFGTVPRPWGNSLGRIIAARRTLAGHPRVRGGDVGQA